MIEFRIYVTVDGREPFREWLDRLRDVRGRARIRARLARVELKQRGEP
jgi:putative component of toxin-antitoxin plasmid stabilization module